MPLRIIAGKARGRRLASPPGAGVRPTGARVREALFDIWGGHLEGLRVLDLCAGSGAVALEALSRGAASVVAVERDGACCRHIRAEAERIDLAGGLEVRQGDVLGALERLRREGAHFDAAFVDPPWEEKALRREILEMLFAPPPLCRHAAVEAPAAPATAGEEPLPPGVRLVKQKHYGRTALYFYESAEQNGGVSPSGGGNL